MRKAKNKIEFEELLKDLFEKLKEKSVDLIEDIDFDKVWDLIEKRIDKCRTRRTKRKAKNE